MVTSSVGKLAGMLEATKSRSLATAVIRAVFLRSKHDCATTGTTRINTQTKERRKTMNTRKAILTSVVVFILTAASLAQQVKTDYDRDANFSKYKTFSFEKIQTKDPLLVDRIKSAVSASLTAKGLSQVDSGGDISIVAMEMTNT